MEIDRDYLRRFALECQRAHDPQQQSDPGFPGRCALCSFTRHPCDTYELATAVLALIDEGQDDVDFT